MSLKLHPTAFSGKLQSIRNKIMPGALPRAFSQEKPLSEVGTYVVVYDAMGYTSPMLVMMHTLSPLAPSTSTRSMLLLLCRPRLMTSVGSTSCFFSRLFCLRSAYSAREGAASCPLCQASIISITRCTGWPSCALCSMRSNDTCPAPAGSCEPPHSTAQGMLPSRRSMSSCSGWCCLLSHMPADAVQGFACQDDDQQSRVTRSCPRDPHRVGLRECTGQEEQQHTRKMHTLE